MTKATTSENEDNKFYQYERYYDHSERYYEEVKTGGAVVIPRVCGCPMRVPRHTGPVSYLGTVPRFTHTRILDLHATRLTASTLKRLYQAFPNVHAMRTRGYYEPDGNLLKGNGLTFPGITHVMFPDTRGFTGLSCIPNGVVKCVVNVICNPNPLRQPRQSPSNAELWISTGGSLYPPSLKSLVFIFIPSAVPHYFPKLKLRPVLQDMMRNNKVEYTLVGLLDLPPACLGSSVTTKDEMAAAVHNEMLVYRVQTVNGVITRCEPPKQINFMTLAEYRALVGEETFTVETKEEAPGYVDG